MSCSKCGQSFQRQVGSAQCGNCKKSFHFQCFGLFTSEDVTTYKALPPAQKLLRKCTDCVANKRRSFSRHQSISDTDFTRSVLDLKAEMIEITNSVKRIDDLSTKLDSFLAKLESYQRENAKLRGRVNKLEEENAGYSRRISNLEGKLAEHDRLAGMSSIEILGAPENIEEDIYNNASEVLSSALGVEIPEAAIAETFLTKKSSKKSAEIPTHNQKNKHNGLWIVKFTSPRMRKRVLDAVRAQGKNKNWSFAATTSSGLRCTIGVRERMSSYTRSIYLRAKERASTCGWRYVWVRDGRVLAREKQGARYHVLHTLADVSKISGDNSGGDYECVGPSHQPPIHDDGQHEN